MTKEGPGKSGPGEPVQGFRLQGQRMHNHHEVYGSGPAMFHRMASRIASSGPSDTLYGT